MNPTDLVERPYLRDDLPDFRPGDTVKVHVRVVEGERERVQVFEGIVIRRSGSQLSETFTVRKISFGVGVERTFPVHSPMIAKIEVATRATCAGPSSTTSAPGSARRRRSKRSARRRPIRGRSPGHRPVLLVWPPYDRDLP